MKLLLIFFLLGGCAKKKEAIPATTPQRELLDEEDLEGLPEAGESEVPEEEELINLK